LTSGESFIDYYRKGQVVIYTGQLDLLSWSNTRFPWLDM